MSSASHLSQLNQECIFSNRAQYRFCVGLGIAFAVACTFLMSAYAYYDQTWTRVSGTVTSAKWEQRVDNSRNGSRTIHSVTFSYVGQSDDGSAVKGRSSIRNAENLRIAVGEKIELLHDPEDPSSSMAIHDLNVILKFALMTGFMVVGCGLLARRFRDKLD